MAVGASPQRYSSIFRKNKRIVLPFVSMAIVITYFQIKINIFQPKAVNECFVEEKV